MTREAPNTIWLQWWPCEDCLPDQKCDQCKDFKGDPGFEHGPTWCQDQVYAMDVEYRRVSSPNQEADINSPEQMYREEKITYSVLCGVSCPDCGETMTCDDGGRLACTETPGCGDKGYWNLHLRKVPR